MLKWSTEIAGNITHKASLETSLPVGIPVTVGTIDAASEAISVGVKETGDMMIMYGSTMFFNKKIFNKNKGFDKNIFLYWEETDYTKRAKKNGYSAYQINTVKVIHQKGKAVKVTKQKEGTGQVA